MIDLSKFDIEAFCTAHPGLPKPWRTEIGFEFPIPDNTFLGGHRLSIFPDDDPYGSCWIIVYVDPETQLATHIDGLLDDGSIEAGVKMFLDLPRRSDG